MIQGFETREITDKPIRAFVKSANGILHQKKSSVNQYGQTEWLTYNHLEENPIAVFATSGKGGVGAAQAVVKEISATVGGDGLEELPEE